MVPRKKKYETGEAAAFLTRKQAMAKLQLNLKDFRRLCILKGVFPREPKNRRRAQKGNASTVKTLYLEKDIRFLLHEPIVWKFRDFKVFLKKLKKAQEKKNWGQAKRLQSNKPKYSLDHIVRERYPTFVDAIRDLEDCLCLCFLYSTFPRTNKTPVEMVELCRRLTVEFMHYVIEARALRKVFCSIKGYYFQADVKGQTVTWIVPHNFGYRAPAQVDMRLMSVFTEFYTTMLGFVNFRLFNSMNLTYPPKLQGLQMTGTSQGKNKGEGEGEGSTRVQEEERVFALNQSLHRTVLPEETVEMDNIPITDDNASMEAARKEAEAVEAQTKLFKGLKFFLGREVPREPLVFMIRSMGGEVSWDATVAPGSTYQESDERITHHIADRNQIPDKKLGRFYVQPQWIFDSINRRSKLNEKHYAIGETLPPHLSPFIADRRVGDYVPPEEKNLAEQDNAEKQDNEADEGEDEEENEEESEEDEEEGEEESEEGEGEEESGEEEEESGEEKENEAEEVKVGTKEKVDRKAEKQLQETEEYRLREMMVPRKHRGLYKSMMKNRKRRINESKNLERKREKWDKDNTPQPKKAKKAKL
eukprot:TRINITY_DN4306_c0_g1_i4.p1 TRINITY_DN4306_c0_g1~~TRINITY_DN4306_c0_g1_i4.p1  ORF type:complete len:587 (+),score=207.34 TRINITY_DN4306_c0_g1_i4:59-1819(+)